MSEENKNIPKENPKPEVIIEKAKIGQLNESKIPDFKFTPTPPPPPPTTNTNNNANSEKSE